jgi:hypothetical protein
VIVMTASRARRRAELAAAVECELERQGRGPARRELDPVGRLRILDARGRTVAIVGEWPAKHRPGLVTEARAADGGTWPPDPASVW